MSTILELLPLLFLFGIGGAVAAILFGGQALRSFDGVSVATRGLIVAGALMFFLGIGSFVKYAADENWIGPVERLALGMAASGAAILVGLLPTFSRYGIWSRVVTGAGFASFSVCILLATNIVDAAGTPLWRPLSALIGQLVVHAIALAVAYCWRRPETAAIALIGGFLGPIVYGFPMVSPMPWVAIAWLALLGGSVAVVALPRRWAGMELITLIGGAANGLLWWWEFGHDAAKTPGLVFTAILGITVLAWTLVNWLRRHQDHWSRSGSITLAGLYLMIGLFLPGLLKGTALGAAWVCAGITFAAAGAIVLHFESKARVLFAWLLTGSLGSFSFAWLVWFDGEYQMTIFAFQALALRLAALRLPAKELGTRRALSLVAVASLGLGSAMMLSKIVMDSMSFGTLLVVMLGAAVAAFLSETHRVVRTENSTWPSKIAVGAYTLFAIFPALMATWLECDTRGRALFQVHDYYQLLLCGWALVLTTWGAWRSRPRLIGLAFLFALAAFANTMATNDWGLAELMSLMLAPNLKVAAAAVLTLLVVSAGFQLAIHRDRSEKRVPQPLMKVLAVTSTLLAVIIGYGTISSQLSLAIPGTWPPTGIWVGTVCSLLAFALMRRPQVAIRISAVCVGTGLMTLSAFCTLMTLVAALHTNSPGSMPAWWALIFVAAWSMVGRILRPLASATTARFASALAFVLSQATLAATVTLESWRLTKDSESIAPWIGPLSDAAPAIASAALATLALVLTAWGFLRADRRFEWMGCAIFFGVILKVFIIDVPSLPPVARIVSFLAVGILLLAGSWIRARYASDKTTIVSPN
ncbi:MAG: DUF2339 domain-containing protein [Planctomycetota bacterium]